MVDGEVPSTVSLSFKCPDGISVSGQDVISPGFLYANVRVKKNQGAAVSWQPQPLHTMRHHDSECVREFSSIVHKRACSDCLG